MIHHNIARYTMDIDQSRCERNGFIKMFYLKAVNTYTHHLLMNKQGNKPGQVFIIIIAFLAWSAIITQFYLMLQNRTAPVAETIIRFFSFFTILTNILVAICATSFLLPSSTALSRFFTRTNTVSAITLYITIVGIVYNVILRFLWEPKHLQMVVDELLHLVIPALFILFWLFFIPDKKLQWKNVLPWMIYPVVYLIYILVRGAFSGFYPYPFIDVTSIGYTKTLINCCLIALLFFVFGYLFTWLARRGSRQ